MRSRSFSRAAGLVAVLSLPFAAANLFTMFAAVHFDGRGMSDPLVLLRAGGSAPTLWRWAMVFDILGYYLLLLPPLLVLHRWLAERDRDWANLAVGLLVAYTLIGASGGGALALALPRLITAYGADPTHRATLETVFLSYTDGIYRGLWNLLEELLAGLGWLVMGLLIRGVRRRLGLITVVLGAVCLADSIGVMINVAGLADSALSVYLVLAPVWACWVGSLILRDRLLPKPTARRPALAESPA